MLQIAKGSTNWNYHMYIWWLAYVYLWTTTSNYMAPVSTSCWNKQTGYYSNSLNWNTEAVICGEWKSNYRGIIVWRGVTVITVVVVVPVVASAAGTATWWNRRGVLLRRTGPASLWRPRVLVMPVPHGRWCPCRRWWGERCWNTNQDHETWGSWNR